MDHLDIEERWLDLAEGALPELEARALRVHLEGCPACAKRYGALSAAHLRSLAAGRLASSLGGVPVPSRVAAQVLAGARREAGPSGRGARRWALVPLAAAAAVAVVFSTRGPSWIAAVSGSPEMADATDARACLLELAVSRGGRGPFDPMEEAAAVAAERWRAGELSARVSKVRCAVAARAGDGRAVEVERRIEGLIDSEGAVLVLTVREGERVAAHLYGADGREVGAALFVDGVRREFLLPPLSEPLARAQLRSPTCGDPGGTPR